MCQSNNDVNFDACSFKIELVKYVGEVEQNDNIRIEFHAISCQKISNGYFNFD